MGLHQSPPAEAESGVSVDPWCVSEPRECTNRALLSDRGRDQAEQGRELIAKEDQRDHARHRRDHKDKAVLDQALSGLRAITVAALCAARHATGPSQRRAFVLATGANCADPQSSGQAAVGQLASRTRTTARPWSTSSAAAPIVSARCWTSRHVLGGRAIG